MAARILIIEDEMKLRKVVSQYLIKYGYEAIEIKDFNNIETEIDQAKADLILLDINLPYLDGFYLCRYIRKKLTTPIIILSARNSDMEQIMGMELGADDYMTKPFNLEILLTKIKAFLRRTYGEYAGNAPQITVNGLLLNPNNFKIAYKEQTLELSKNEFKLLKRLMESTNTIVSREDLLVELWDESAFVEDNTLTVNMTRLKNKLETLGLKDIIKTKRGLGYLLDWSE